MKISAYLIIYNDYDILEASLESVVGYVDEIVVVDGAYTWLAPFFERVGHRADQSAAECLSIIDKFKSRVTIKYFSGLWKDESEKRKFAYEQCVGDIIWLIDADEIFLVDQTALASFAKSDRLVAGFFAPTLLTDTQAFKRQDREGFGIKNAMLKRASLTASEHLGALWLVVPEKERKKITPIKGAQTFPEPLGYNYHATLLRTHRTAVHRARFYVINAIRESGKAFWLPASTEKGSIDLEDLVNSVQVDEFNRYLLGHSITIGLPSLEGREVVTLDVPEPQRGALGKTFEDFMSAWKDVVPDRPENYRALAKGVPHAIDISAMLSKCNQGGIAIKWQTNANAGQWKARLLVLGSDNVLRAQSLMVACEGIDVKAEGFLEDSRFSRAVIEVTASWREQGTVFVHLHSLQCM
ncbi:glycosyltransferase family protein [Acidisoma sp. 7E03]